MGTRKASVKETGEELSQEEWARFEDAAEGARSERPETPSEETLELPDKVPTGDRPKR